MTAKCVYKKNYCYSLLSSQSFKTDLTKERYKIIQWSDPKIKENSNHNEVNSFLFSILVKIFNSHKSFFKKNIIYQENIRKGTKVNVLYADRKVYEGTVKKIFFIKGEQDPKVNVQFKKNDCNGKIEIHTISANSIASIIK